MRDDGRWEIRGKQEVLPSYVALGGLEGDGEDRKTTAYPAFGSILCLSRVLSSEPGYGNAQDRNTDFGFSMEDDIE